MKKIYKWILILIVIILLVGLFFLVTKNEKKEENKIEIESSNISLVKDSIYSYRARCTTENCSLTYKSTNEEIITVNEEGDITAKAEGEALLIIESGNIKKEVTVYVTNEEVMTTGIQIKEETKKMNKGEKTLLEVDIFPSRATRANIIWTSSDLDVVTINGGYIEAKNEGIAKITVRVEDMEVEDTMVVTVGKGATQKVESIEFEQEVITMGLNETYQLTPIIRPINSENKQLTYIVEDSSIIEIDDSGLIRSKGKGKTSVDVVATNGVSKVIEVKVEPKDEELAINTEEVTIARGETYQLKSNYVSGIEWYSSNNKVATVNASGVVRGISNGETTITVINRYGRVNTTKVVVKGSGIQVSSIQLDKNEISIKPGGSYQIKSSVLPNNATNRELIWETSDSRIVQVTDSGEIMGLMTGEAIVTAYANNGKQAIVKVKVSPTAISIDSLEINPSSITLIKGDSFQLRANIVPSNATNKTVTWESSDSSVVSVDHDGKLTANKTGYAVITARSNGLISKATVEVKTSTIALTSLTINENDMSIKEGETARLTVSFLPSNATNKDFIWESDNSSVSVSNKGVVTGLKEGTANITVKSVEGIKDDIQIVVIKRKNSDGSGNGDGNVSENTGVTEVLLNIENVNIHIGQTKQLRATVLPLNAPNNSLTWISSNEDVVSISNTGLLTGNKPGSAQVSVITDNGKVARTNVTVTNPPIYDRGEKLIELYSEKLIVTATKYKNTGIRVVRVWVADPYKQFHKVDAQNGDKELVTDIINKEIGTKNLTNSILIGGNSLFTTNGRRNGNLIITEGNVLLYNPGGPLSKSFGSNTLFYAGIASNGELQFYCTKPKSNCAGGSVSAEAEDTLFQAIIQSGMKNTIPLPFESMIIWNGKVIDQSWDKRYGLRHMFCQVDANNFVITVSGNGDLVSEHQDLLIEKKCKTAMNLDGGGSVNVFYKDRGARYVSHVHNNTRPRPDAYYFAEF